MSLASVVILLVRFKIILKSARSRDLGKNLRSISNVIKTIRATFKNIILITIDPVLTFTFYSAIFLRTLN